jgi:hypothetical protein
VPVVVRCDSAAIDLVAELIIRLGGTIRHQLRIVSALAAWIPLNAVEELAQDAGVNRLELVQNFTIA